MLIRDETVLPVTHTFNSQWNELQPVFDSDSWNFWCQGRILR